MDEVPADPILSKLDSLSARFDGVMVELNAIREQLTALAPRVDSGKVYLTVKEAAEYFNLSQASLYKLKRLQCRRGRSVRFRRSDLELHLRASRDRT